MSNLPFETRGICVNLRQRFMLEDRDYMRPASYGEPRVSWTVILLAANVAAFLVQMLAAQWFLRGTQIEGQYFELSLDGLQSG